MTTIPTGAIRKLVRSVSSDAAIAEYINATAKRPIVSEREVAAIRKGAPA
jgi:hypothetical protein